MRYSVFSGTNNSQEAWLALRSLFGRVADGPEVAEFERDFAALVGTDYAFSFATGRMGLYCLMESLGIGPGDEVIVPAFTCVVVPNAVLYRGARPIYVDIEPTTYNISPSAVAAAMSPRTKAIVAQHTFGLACDVDSLNEIAAKYSAVVVEDCAHALGASVGGRPAGSLATAAYFSTDHTKMIGTGTGGMVTTSDERLARKLRVIQEKSPYPPAWKIRLGLIQFAVEVLMTPPSIYRLTRLPYKVLWRLILRNAFYLDELSLSRPAAYPYPARLGRAHARLGISQLSSFRRNLAWRRSMAARYERAIGVLGPRLEKDAANHSFLRYTFDVDDREAFERHFAHVLEMSTWFDSVVQGRRRDLEKVGYEPGSCPVGESAARHCVNLPTHPRVKDIGLLLERLQSAPGLRGSHASVQNKGTTST